MLYVMILQITTLLPFSGFQNPNIPATQQKQLGDMDRVNLLFEYLYLELKL